MIRDLPTRRTLRLFVIWMKFSILFLTLTLHAGCTATGQQALYTPAAGQAAGQTTGQAAGQTTGQMTDARSDSSAVWSLASTRWNGTFLNLNGAISNPSGISATPSGISIKNARALDFHPDGTSLYIVGRSSENIVTYTLAEPWEVGSATATSSFDLSGIVGSRNQGSVAHGLWFRKDTGRTFFVFNRTEVFRFDTDTPWDVAGARLAGYADVRDVVRRGHDIDLHPDGTVLYVDDRGKGAVHQFRMDEAWDLSTLEFEVSLDISEQEKAVRGLEFRRDGRRFFVMDTSRREVLEYEVPEAWSVRGAVYRGAFSVAGQAGNPRSVTWKPDGRCFYVTDTSDGAVYPYEVPGGCVEHGNGGGDADGGEDAREHGSGSENRENDGGTP